MIAKSGPSFYDFLGSDVVADVILVHASSVDLSNKSLTFSRTHQLCFYFNALYVECLWNSEHISYTARIFLLSTVSVIVADFSLAS